MTTIIFSLPAAEGEQAYNDMCFVCHGSGRLVSLVVLSTVVLKKALLRSLNVTPYKLCRQILMLISVQVMCSGYAAYLGWHIVLRVQQYLVKKIHTIDTHTTKYML